MTNYEAWVAAAKPTQNAQGYWVDANGHQYQPEWDYVRNKLRTFNLSGKSLDARAGVKLYGAKALKGTAKQKEWAEKIRADKVSQLRSIDDAIIVCDPTSLAATAAFWIDNRTRSGAEFVAFIKECRALLAMAKALKESGESTESTEYAAVAAQYNALTSAWGF